MLTVSVLGAGWLGFPLCQELQSSDYRVKASRRSRSGLDELHTAGMEAYEVRVNIPEEGFYFSSANFFECFSLVVTIPPGRKREGFEKIYPKEMRLLAERIDRYSNATQVIYTSSTGVFASKQGEVSDATEPDPDRKGGEAVLEAENELRKVLGERLTVVRFGGLIGGDRHPARQLAKKTQLSGGHHPVNLIGRSDATRILSTLIYQRKVGVTLNACCPEHPTRQEFYTSEAKRLGYARPQFDETDTTNGKVIRCHYLESELKYQFIATDPRDILK